MIQSFSELSAGLKSSGRVFEAALQVLLLIAIRSTGKPEYKHEAEAFEQRGHAILPSLIHCYGEV